MLSVRIVIHGRRPNLALETSSEAWADIACRTGRPGNRPRLTGRPVIAEALFMLMPAASLGFGCRDYRNHHQRGCEHGHCQKSDHKFAHAMEPAPAQYACR